MTETFADQLNRLQQMIVGRPIPYQAEVAALLERYERLRRALEEIAKLAGDSTRDWASQIEGNAHAALADCPPIKEFHHAEPVVLTEAGAKAITEAPQAKGRASRVVDGDAEVDRLRAVEELARELVAALQTLRSAIFCLRWEDRKHEMEAAIATSTIALAKAHEAGLLPKERTEKAPGSGLPGAATRS